jgi:hypothetical protein
MSEIAALIRRLKARARRKIFVDWLSTTLLCAFGAGSVFSLIYLIVPITLHPSYIVWGTIAAAALLSATAALATKHDSHRLLAAADSRLGQRSTLITAFDLASKDSDNQFRSIIVGEAERAAKTSNAKIAFPIDFPGRARVLPFLFLLLISLHLLSLAMTHRAPEPEVQRAGALLENYGRTLAERAEDNDLGDSLRIAQEMERLGRLLQQRRLNRERVDQRLAEMSKRIEDRMEGVSRNQNPESGEVDNSEAESTPQGDGRGERQPQSRITKDTIEQLRQELLRQGSITDEEARFLEQTAEDLDDGKPADSFDGDSESRLDDLMNRSRRNQETAALESAEKTVREAQRSLGGARVGADAEGQEGAGHRGGEELSQGGRDSAGAGDSESGGGGDSESGDMNGGSGSNTAGELAMQDEMTDDFQRREGESVSMMGELDGEISGNDEALKTLVRNLPEDTVSLLPTEGIMVEYARRVEEAINQEEIPVGMRNYIKNYFLRIGLKEGED